MRPPVGWPRVGVTQNIWRVNVDEVLDVVTLDLHVRFVRAVTEGVSRLRTEAHVTHAGNRTVTAEGRIVGPDGKVYAMGTASCLVLKMEQ
jgi:uncharacterized protein (TIGR00369 family)